MKAGHGKRKGSQFERDISKALSLWISNGTQEDVFWRSSQSGGRSTTAFKKGKRFSDQAGDICSLHPVGRPLTEKFMLELKHYADLNFIGLLTGRGHLVKFWQKASEQATFYNKWPMMIAKQNAQPVIVCLSREGAKELAIKLKCILCAPRLNLYIFLFDDFLKFAARPGGVECQSLPKKTP